MLKTLLISSVSLLMFCGAANAASACQDYAWPNDVAVQPMDQPEFEALLRCYGHDDPGATEFFGKLYNSIPEDEASLLRWYRILTTSVGTLARSENIQRNLADQFLARIDKLGSERKDLEGTIKDLEQKLADAAATSSALDGQMSSLSAERDVARAKLDDHKRVVDTLEQERRSIAQKLEAATKTEAVAKSEMESANAERDAAFTVNARLQLQLDTLQKQVDAATIEQEAAKKQMAEIAVALLAKEDELGAEQNTVADLQLRLSNLTSDLSLKVEVAAKQVAQIGELSDQIEVLTESLSQTTEEKSAMERLLSEANSAQEELLKKLAAQESALKVATAKVVAVEKSAQQLTVSNAKVAKSLEDTTAQRDALEQQVKELTATVEANAAQIAGLEQNIANQAADMVQKQGIIEDLSSEKQNLQRLEQELKRHNGEIEARLAALELDKTSLEEIVGNLKGMVLSLEGENNTLKTNVAALSGENAKLTGEADRLTSQNDRLAETTDLLFNERLHFAEACTELMSSIPAMEVDQNSCLLPNSVTFVTNSAELTSDGSEMVRQLARSLMEVTSEFPPLEWRIEVAGHTDSRAVRGGPYPTNWELSFARALAVTRVMIDEYEVAVAAGGIVIDLPKRLAPVGYADMHPVDPDTTTEAYERNRRTEFRLVN